MEKQENIRTNKGKLLIISGFIIIAILFLIYARSSSLELTPEAIPVLERVAVVFYIILILSIVAISFGLYKYHNQKVFENKEGLLSIIATVPLTKKFGKLFILILMGKGVFFFLI